MEHLQNFHSKMNNHVAYERTTMAKSQMQQMEHENNSLKYQVAELQNQLHQERQMQQMLVQELEESKQLMQQSAQMQRDLLNQQQQLQSQLQHQNLSMKPNFAFTATAIPDQVNQTLQIIEKSHSSDLQSVIHQQKLQMQNLEAQIERDKDKQMAQQQQINLLQFQLESKNETINSLIVIQNDLQQKLKQSNPHCTESLMQTGQQIQQSQGLSGGNQKSQFQQMQASQKFMKQLEDQAIEIQRLQKQLNDQEYHFKQQQFQMQQQYNNVMLENQQMRQYREYQDIDVKQLIEQYNALKNENIKLMNQIQNYPQQPNSVEHVPNSKKQEQQQSPSRIKPGIHTEDILNNVSTLVQQSRLQEREMQGMEYNSQELQSQPSSSTPQTVQQQDLNQNSQNDNHKDGLFDNLFLDRDDKRVQSIQFDEPNKTPTDNATPSFIKPGSKDQNQGVPPKKQLSPIESLQQKKPKSPSPVRRKPATVTPDNNIQYQKFNVSELNNVNEKMDIEENDKGGTLITEIQPNDSNQNIDDQKTLPVNPPPINRNDKLSIVKNAIMNNKQAEMQKQELQFEEDFGIDDLNH